MIPDSMPIFVAAEPIDMRRSFDGLAKATTEVLNKNPQDRALFVFYNRKYNRLKILWWDRSGFCLLYKRLEPGQVFRIPELSDARQSSVEISVDHLASLLQGVPRRITRKVRREISRKVKHSALRKHEDAVRAMST